MLSEKNKLTDQLFSDYGKCIVPKGCFLFRRAIDYKIYPTMFFGFEVGVTHSAEHKSEEIQIWKLKEDIVCLYPIKEITLNKWYKSSLEDLCIKHISLRPEDAYYLAIKKNDNPVRRSLIKFLNSNGIFSWVGDCEGKADLELFLFNDPSEIGKHVEFKGFAKKDDPNLYEYDYLKYVNIIHNPALIRTHKHNL